VKKVSPPSPKAPVCERQSLERFSSPEAGAGGGAPSSSARPPQTSSVRLLPPPSSSGQQLLPRPSSLRRVPLPSNWKAIDFCKNKNKKGKKTTLY
jgi:hypothetical protein